MSLPSPFSPKDEPVFLMDGSAFIHRGFHVSRNLQRADGFPTGTIFLVSRMLLRILRQEHPRWFAFVKDGKGKNFRHEIYPEYKANRPPMPEELAVQLGPIERMVKALGLPWIVSEGCEADDCIASLAERFAPKRPVVVVSGDKDMKQLLSERVVLWDPGAKQEKLTTAEDFVAEWGFAPSFWPDFQALTGDKVDDIPGVPGVGPVKAKAIFGECLGLEAVRDGFPILSSKHQKLLDGHLEEMFRWRELTALRRTELPGVTLDDLAVRVVDVEAALALAEEFELSSLRADIEDLAGRERRAFLGMPVKPAAGRTPVRTRPSAGARGKQSGCLLPPADAGPAGGAVKTLSLFDLAAPKADLTIRECADPAELPEAQGMAVALIWPDGLEGDCCAAVGRKLGAGAAIDQSSDQASASGEGAIEFRWKGEADALASWAARADTLVVADAKRLMEAGAPWRDELVRRADGQGLFDLGLAAYLFNPEEGDYGWERLCAWAQSTDPAKGPLGPGALALGLARRSLLRLERDGQDRLYRELELPLLPVLVAMQEQGIAIDMVAFQAFLEEVQKEIAAISETVFREAGGPFNLRSSQQLGELLFTKLGLPQSGKTKTGQFSTSQESLEKLAGKHPVVDAMLRYRKFEKLRSTYLEPLPKLTDAAGRLHTTFNQEATATGRLSSSGPNLQNIPVRGPLGKRMRACFVAGEGRLLASCDYSQIELRVLAHMSQDKALLEAFRKGEDIHARTAALVYGIEPDQVTPDQRRSAKTVNFGLIYGMGAQKLARDIGIKTAEAKAFIERYFQNLTGLEQFYAEVEERAARDGYVTTLGGRRRYLPGLASASGQVYALAKRQAFNTVIQGSAADIIKLAMIAVARDPQLQAWQARLALQIHDELVLEVPEAHAEVVALRVKELMESVRPAGQAFSVPLAVDWGVARDWGEAH
ncbi:MAG: DNA polymerase I [Desulfovibrio sp.]|nr:DNA polymerase I [Desulfovibrio sp.]